MKLFDPFSERTSCDIRNSLSSAIVTELRGEGDRYVDTVAGRWLDEVDEEPYRSYIVECQTRYGRVLDHIRNQIEIESRMIAF